MMNVETGDSRFGLVRAACSPSMKSGVYVVSAWFERVTGSIVGAHCECVAGLSKTCQHVAGLLFAVVEAGSEGPGEQASCTDLPCKWIVSGEAKKPVPKLPLEDIFFRKHVINKPSRSKVNRNYSSSKRKTTPSEDILSLKKKTCQCLPNTAGTALHSSVS